MQNHCPLVVIVGSNISPEPPPYAVYPVFIPGLPPPPVLILGKVLYPEPLLTFETVATSPPFIVAVAKAPKPKLPDTGTTIDGSLNPLLLFAMVIDEDLIRL